MDNRYRAPPSPYESQMHKDPRFHKRPVSSDDSDDDSDEEVPKNHRRRQPVPQTQGADVTTTPQVNNASRPPKSRRSLYLQIVMAIAAIGCFLLGVLLKYENLSPGIIWGSILTLLSVIAVLVSYASDPLSRQHPNPLVFWRTIADGFFVVRLLSEQFVRCLQYECSPLCKTFNCGCAVTQTIVPLPAGADTCVFFSGFFQFSLLASECWFLCMTLNLFLSLTNPFTDFKRNTRLFHMFSWGLPLLTAILLMSVDDFAGYSDFDTCWTNALRHTTVPNLTKECVSKGKDFILEDKFGSLQINYISWGFFYIPMVLFITVGLVVWFWTYNRLREGLPETYGVRKQSIDRARFLVMAVSVYWALVFAVYAAYLSMHDNQSKRRWKEVVNFLMAAKGYVDLVIWFHLNDFRVPRLSGLCSKSDKTIDIDLNPQVNAALRREVLFYTTSGIIQAVQQAETLAEDVKVQHLALRPQGVAETSDRKFTKTFHDYVPHAFRKIRQRFGVDNIRYLKSLSSTAKERLSEGASGAFMFFSGDGSLIVKSTSPEECHFLRSIAEDYAAYVVANPETLLTRFYGCHCLELYGQKFSFVVMANLFDTKQVIHSRYDIKGSWVNRKGGLPKRGKKVTCRHCNRKYVFESTAKEDFNCDVRLGGHEPNIVLKDSDLTQKLKLETSVAVTLYRQLEADSNLLCQYGIMDYSLLMGIHDVEFSVEVMDYGSRRHLLPSQTMPPRSGRRDANTVVGPAYYHLGIIDILQTWTFEKRMERFLKIHLRRVDGDGLSAIEPEKYKKRFQAKMADILGVSHLIAGTDTSPHDIYTAIQNSQMDIEASDGAEDNHPRSMPYLTHTGSLSDYASSGHIHL
ncbi:unnamed protein product [Aphanomyces euteiches]|uniref:PIPK domain-containing protein n=2 Tax=Aphanomyces euteiches TaxID=100861 RepID=A0A6G0XDG9_9STRA|nr:hypothetical protein Ae201684_005826 [Aphanomyces euteiches]KAH9078496.1 hypothetical protein Ae201684P_019581 [Aphanomyces euteiches]KAH9086342.1 hypothetical protein LEN26_020234 [Aphanomyces euteiches]KAH9116812.1 hypothetical protein AeMF1_009269 [Aphanomyces euteiches]KAH9136961.1 hypothetical protein AeRB84_018073 [Aphanomyces euteiches]